MVYQMFGYSSVRCNANKKVNVTPGGARHLGVRGLKAI